MEFELTLIHLSFVLVAFSLTLEILLAISAEASDAWDVLSLTSWVPCEAWLTLSVISEIVSLCSSIAEDMATTISLTSVITPEIIFIWSTVAPVEELICSIFFFTSSLAS